MFQSDDDVADPREQAFHDMVRENVIFLLILIILYGFSYLLISSYRKRRDEIYADEEDALVYRISFWMCTLSLATSIASALMLPFSLITNEVLLIYPDNYYMQWLNDSLIKGLWNYIFLFSNISLFVLLPFAYFFPESEGFSTSRRGLISRIYETLVLLLLFSVLISGLAYIFCSILGYTEMALTNLLNMNNYLALLYSCVSFLGVLLLLLCTPIGIARLFTVFGELIMRPRFLRNVQEEYEIIILEEMHLARKIRNIKDELQSPIPSPIGLSPGKRLSPWVNFCQKSLSVPSLPDLICADQTEKSFVAATPSMNRVRDNSEIFNRYNLQIPSWVSPHRPSPYSSPLSPKNVTRVGQLHELEKNLQNVLVKRKDLENQKRASAFRRNFGYPIAMLFLLSLTAFAALLVVQNTLELLVGLKALPSSSAQTFVVGITSLSKMGLFGACLEIILILYLWCASIVGLYTLPGLGRLKPKIGETTFNQCVINCALLLILSTALPVLARTVGITNFDLLGNFGRIRWLDDFWVVFLYNIVFAATTALSLTDKFTVSVRKELYRRLEASLIWSWTWKWKKLLTVFNSPPLEVKTK